MGVSAIECSHAAHPCVFDCTAVHTEVQHHLEEPEAQSTRRAQSMD